MRLQCNLLLRVLIVLFFINCICISALADGYIVNTVQGKVCAYPGQADDEEDSYLFTLNQAGTTVVKLEWDADAELNLNLLDFPVESIEYYRFNKCIIANIIAPELTESIDINILVTAFQGAADYTLDITKPDQTVTDLPQFFNRVAMYDYTVASGEENLIALKALQKGLNNVTVRVLDRSTKRIVFEQFFPEQVELPTSLAPGQYQLFITKKSASDSGEVLVQNAVRINFEQDFTLRSIQAGGVDTFEFTKINEKYIWFIWDKIVQDQSNPLLQAVCTDLAGNELIKAVYVDPNGAAYIPVDDLPSGTYNLRVSSIDTAFYALAGEYANGIRPIEITDYALENTLNVGDEVRIALNLGDETDQDIQTTGTSLIQIPIRLINDNSYPVKVSILVMSYQNQPVGSGVFELAANEKKETTVSAQITLFMNYYLLMKTEQGKAKVAVTGKSGQAIPRVSLSKLKPIVEDDELVVNTEYLTYFSGWTSKDWGKVEFSSTHKVITDEKWELIMNGNKSNYLDLESVPLYLKRSFIEKNGSVTQNKNSDYIIVKGWKLIPGAKGQYPATDQSGRKLVSPTDPTNKVCLFEGPGGETRLVVEWLTDVKEEVGTLVCKLENGKQIESKIIVYPVDVDAYHPSNPAWDQTILDMVKQAKQGITISGKTYRLTIPFHMIQGKIQTECSYMNKAKRYEPFADMFNFHEETTSIYQKMIDKQDSGVLYPGDERIELGKETIYDQYMKDPSAYKPSWHDNFKVNYEALGAKYKGNGAENLQKRLIELYLNWGKEVAYLWINKECKDLFDPIKFNESWSHIYDYKFKMKNDQNQLIEVHVTVNSAAANNKYSLNDQQLWTVAADEGKFYIYLNKVIKRHLDAKQRVINQSALTADVKKYLELYISYKHKDVFDWYEKGEQEPFTKFPKPWIAQTVVVASYGPSQVMVATAWDYGYTIDPTTDGNELDLYSNSIPIGVKMLVRNFSRTWGANQLGANGHYWLTDWNYILRSYNGSNKYAYMYPGNVRNYEKLFMVRPKLY